MLSLLQHNNYIRADLVALLRDVVDGFPALVAPGPGCASVLLKPNFVMPAPRTDASTTHPEFYMAVADVLLERGFKVGIGESPAFGSCEKALRVHGVLDECRERGIEVVEFRQPSAYAGVSTDKSYADLTIASELSNWDAIVNLPKLKTHQQFTFTAATKNLYGCVTGKRKAIRHNLCANDPVRFARMVLANAAQAACVAHIGDGITALHVKGPRGGQPFELGVVVACDDYLAHDWLFCALTGLDPANTPLFQAVSDEQREALRDRCAAIVDAPDFPSTDEFIHASLIDISFSPFHLARSGWRSLRQSFSASA